MAKATTKSFVATFPLKVDQGTANILEKRFKAANAIYNGVLGESLRRATRMRHDPGWKAARAMPAKTPEQTKARRTAFETVRKKHQFGQYELQKYAEGMRDNSWIDHHLGSHDTQTTALRAFRCVSGWIYKGKGKPRFKPLQEMRSVEGKSNDAVIRFRDNAIMWAGLKIPLMLAPKNRDKTSWQADALACKTKYVRIVREKLRGKIRFYAQLVQEGKPPSRGLPLAKKGTWGCIDRGPSKIDIVVEDKKGRVKLAASLPLAPFAEEATDKIRLIQRAMDRSRRAANPNNYHPNGTVKKGARKWIKSRRYLQNGSTVNFKTSCWPRPETGRKKTFPTNHSRKTSDEVSTEEVEQPSPMVSKTKWRTQADHSYGSIPAPPASPNTTTPQTPTKGNRCLRASTFLETEKRPQWEETSTVLILD
jgi:putative transposase